MSFGIIGRTVVVQKLIHVPSAKIRSLRQSAAQFDHNLRQTKLQAGGTETGRTSAQCRLSCGVTWLNRWKSTGFTM